MTAALDSPVAKNCHTISCSNIWLYAGHLPVSVFTMTIFDLPPINALHARFDRRLKMGKFTLPIWLYISVTGVYFMLNQWFPSAHFGQLRQRHEVKVRGENRK